MTEGMLILLEQDDPSHTYARTWLAQEGWQKHDVLHLTPDSESLLLRLHQKHDLLVFLEARFPGNRQRSRLDGLEVLVRILGNQSIRISLIPILLATFLETEYLPDYCPPDLVLRLPCPAAEVANRYRRLRNESVRRDAVHYFQSRHVPTLRDSLLRQLDHTRSKLPRCRGSVDQLERIAGDLSVEIAIAATPAVLWEIQGRLSSYSGAVTAALSSVEMPREEKSND